MLARDLASQLILLSRKVAPPLVCLRCFWCRPALSLLFITSSPSLPMITGFEVLSTPAFTWSIWYCMAADWPTLTAKRQAGINNINIWVSFSEDLIISWSTLFGWTWFTSLYHVHCFVCCCCCLPDELRFASARHIRPFCWYRRRQRKAVLW